MSTQSDCAAPQTVEEAREQIKALKSLLKDRAKERKAFSAQGQMARRMVIALSRLDNPVVNERMIKVLTPIVQEAGLSLSDVVKPRTRKAKSKE